MSTIGDGESSDNSFYRDVRDSWRFLPGTLSSFPDFAVNISRINKFCAADISKAILNGIVISREKFDKKTLCPQRKVACKDYRIIVYFLTAQSFSVRL